MTHQSISCVIIGAGPAGLSAALWLKQLGLDFLVLDARRSVGGELPHINLPIHNHLGLRADHGRAFLTTVVAQVADKDLPIQLNCAVQRVDAVTRRVMTDMGEWHAQAIIVASGLTRRKLEVPGAAELVGRGVSYSATTDMVHMADKNVVIVGGGDGAVENALLVAKVARSVTLVHRSPSFSARPAFVQAAQTHPRITCLMSTKVERVLGTDRVQALGMVDANGHRTLQTDQVVVKIGFIPNAAFVVGPETLKDRGGYLSVDRWMRTSVPGILAAGDVCNPRSPCIAGAVGDGAVAAQEAYRFVVGNPST